MRFGGLKAVDELSFEARTRRHHRRHRPQRRRQDDGVQLHHRILPPDRRHRSPSTHPAGSAFPLHHMPGHRIAAAAKVARTFQNIRLFAGMTVLENLLVAQHNTLMAATGFGVLAVLGLGRYRTAEAAGMEKARSLAGRDRPDRPRRRSRRRTALWRATPAGDRPRHVHRPGAALPGRTRRRPEPARDRRS